MPPFYIGGSGAGGGKGPILFNGGPISSPGGMRFPNVPVSGKTPTLNGGVSGPGGTDNASQGTASSTPNILGPQAVRPTGPSGGFDTQYLQNLATAIGGLFSRPGRSLNFNPLGNLSDVQSPNLGFGNAPSPGLPSTMLQDAINGLAFMFNQPATTPPITSPIAGGSNSGNRNNGGRGGYPISQ